MTTIPTYLADLKAGGISLTTARQLFQLLSEQMTNEEKAEAVALIGSLELTELTKPKDSPLLSIVPNGWLRDYLAYAQISEAPDPFHLFAAVSALSHLLNRRFWHSLGTLDVYPPFSVFLVSPAGQARRSTAARAAAKIASMAGANVLQDSVTPEGLIAALSENPDAWIVADEAATILNKTDYMSQMPQILCTLLDGTPSFERRLRSGVVRVENPTVNVLICCAPDWISTAMPKSALGGGLFSRMLTIFEPAKKKSIPFPEDVMPGEDVKKMERSLGHGLRLITDQTFGKLTFTPRAKETFERFYRDNDIRLAQANDNFAPYLSRKPMHIARLSMCYLASQGRGTELDLDTLERVLATLKLVEGGMEEVYRTAGLEKAGTKVVLIEKTLRRAGGRMSRADLMRKLAYTLDRRELDEVLKTMMEAGRLREEYMQTKTRPARYYELVAQ